MDDTTAPPDGLMSIKNLRRKREFFTRLIDQADPVQRRRLEDALEDLDRWIVERSREAA